MSRTILIIGAGLEQVPAYKLAKSMGLKVVGTDMDKDAPGFEFSDYSLIASTRNVQETCDVVSQFAVTHEIHGVLTIANDVPYTVAAVAELLGLPGAEKSAVKNLTNKIVMKQAFKEEGVSTPDFMPVKTLANLQEAKSRFGCPFILKPTDGRGSKGVLYIEEGLDLEWAYNHASAYCDNGVLIAEEFVSGPQLSVEGMFSGARYEAVAFADRNYDNLALTKPFIVEDGGTIPSYADLDLQERIRKTIEAGAKAVGVMWGTVKADIVLDDNGQPSIIELAGRLSGNYLATHHVPYAYGIDLVGCLIDACLGHEIAPERLKPLHKKYLGVRYFFPQAGRITAIEGVEEVSELPYVHELMVYPKIGDIQPDVSHHGARAGTVMVEGSTYKEATDRAIDAASKIKFTIEPEGNLRKSI